MDPNVYRILYDFQLKSIAYVLSLNGNYSSTQAVMFQLMIAACGALYQLDSSKTAEKIALLETLSNTDRSVLAVINVTDIINTYTGLNDFTDELIHYIDIYTLEYFDGFEWAYVYNVQRLMNDPSFLATEPTAYFYEYITRVSNPFSGSDRCTNANSLLSQIYPSGYDELFYSTFDLKVQILHTAAEWDTVFSTLKSQIDNYPSIDTSLGLLLIEYSVYYSVINNMSNLRPSLENRIIRDDSP